jgi:hypothetical protein
MESDTPPGARSPFLAFQPGSFPEYRVAGEIHNGERVITLTGIYPAGLRAPLPMPHAKRNPTIRALLDEARSNAITELSLTSRLLARLP